MQEELITDTYTETYLEPVSVGKRFANYLIDIIVFYFITFFLGVALALIDYRPIGVMLYVMVYIVLVGYYTILEGATNGRTIGKMITGCRAIKADDTPFTWNDAFLRSLCRIVPFEPFSALGGRPWHDSWTNTKVVKNTKPLNNY